jgi:hypothetical protein
MCDMPAVDLHACAVRCPWCVDHWTEVALLWQGMIMFAWGAAQPVSVLNQLPITTICQISLHPAALTAAQMLSISATTKDSGSAAQNGAPVVSERCACTSHSQRLSHGFQRY